MPKADSQHLFIWYLLFTMMFRSTLLAALLLVFSASLQAQSADREIRGRVIVPQGNANAHAGIEIQMQRPSRLVVDVAYTDRDGKFFFHNIERADVYYLYINLDGYNTVRERVNVTGGAMSSANVTIILNPGTTQRYSELPTARVDDPAEAAEEVVGTPEAALEEYEGALIDAGEGNVSRAVRRLQSAVRLAPAFFDAYMELGFIQQQRGKYDEAEEAFGQALTVDPDSAEPAIGQGGVNLDRARVLEDSFTPDAATRLYQETVTLLEAASVKAPRSARVFYYLGSALYKLDQIEYAESTLEWSLGRDDPVQDARLMLVNIYMKQRRYREAAEQLTTYLDKVPESPQRKAVEKMLDEVQKVLQQ